MLGDPAWPRSRPQKNGLKVELERDGARMFDQILVAVGRVPNGGAIEAEAAGVTVDERGFIPVDSQMRTNVPGIYAIGDIVGGPMLAHKATHEGKVAAEVIAGQRRRVRRPGDPVGGLHRPRGGLDGPDRDRGQGRGRRVREGGRSPGPRRGGRSALGRDEGLTKLLVEPESGACSAPGSSASGRAT